MQNLTVQSRSWFLCLLVLGWPAPALAWWVGGHERIARATASALPEEMPAFFRAGAVTLAHCSGDPDRWKNRDTSSLRATESPDHYIDLENWKGEPLPEDRYKAIATLLKMHEQPEQTGMLPYAIMENFDRLTVAFYDYRQNPDNEAVRMKCLVYAGVLAHYTGDSSMPLHTTRDYDGRRAANGQLAQKGIHARLDSFPEKQGFTSEEIGRELRAREIADMWKHVLRAIHESHGHVSRCYELDTAGGFERPTAESRAFILERCRAGAQFTMDVYYNAWKRSARLRPPY